MAQKYIEGDVVMYGNNIMIIKEPREEGHFDLLWNNWIIYSYINIEDIKPIPLTPEILEKNGWKKFKRPYSSDYCYRRKGYPTLNIRSEKEVYFHWGYHDKSITTMHQLQHLLFGPGINHESKIDYENRN